MLLFKYSFGSGETVYKFDKFLTIQLILQKPKSQKENERKAKCFILLKDASKLF